MAEKLLMVCPNGEFGGAERTALNFASALRTRGNWIPEVALLRPGNLEPELKAAGISYTLIPPFRLSRPATWKAAVTAIAELARTGGARLIHSEMAYGQIVGGSAALAARLPALWYQHGPIDPWSAQQRIAACIPAAGFLTNSRHSLGIQPRLLFPAARAVIPPPLAADFLSRARDRALRQKLGIRADETVALLPARFQPRFKGQLLALTAYAPLARELAASRLILLGAPESEGHRDYADYLEVKTAAARVNHVAAREAVLILPFDRDVIPYFDAADIVVNSTLIPEPFGCTLVEAMARGNLIVAGAAGGVLDIAKGATPAFLYSLADENSLRDALRRAFLTDPEERYRLSVHAKERARDYLADGLTAKLEEFYSKLIR